MNNEYPLVSVITLTYKNYDNLFKTIDSVLSQDYHNIEYTISDDGSGDFPEKEVRDYINKKGDNLKSFQLIENPNNVGTVKNFNNAIRNSRGEYILPLNSDDIFCNNTVVSGIVGVFKSLSCDMLLTSRIAYSDGKLKKFYPHFVERKKIYELESSYDKYRTLMLSEHYIMYSGCNTYYSRSAIEKHGYFDENYVLLEDYPMYEKIMWDGNVALRPDMVTIFYNDKTGVSAKGNKNPILKKEISRFNQFGKLKHYNELDRKTQKHIDFGIKRAEAKTIFAFFVTLIRFWPRLVSYAIYVFGSKLAGVLDRRYINEYSRDINLECIIDKQISDEK